MKLKLTALAIALSFGTVAQASELYFTKTAQITMANNSTGALVDEAFLDVSGVIDLKETVYQIPGHIGTTEYPSESPIKISVGESIFTGSMQCQEHQETGTPFVRCFLVEPMQEAIGQYSGSSKLNMDYLDIYPPNRTFSKDIAYINERRVNEWQRGYVYPKDLYIDAGGNELLLREVTSNGPDNAFRNAHTLNVHSGARLTPHFTATSFGGIDVISKMFLDSELATRYLQSISRNDYLSDGLGSVPYAGGILHLSKDLQVPSMMNNSALTVNADVTLNAVSVVTGDNYYLARKSLSVAAGASTYLLPVSGNESSLTVPASTPSGGYALVARVFDKGTGGQSTYVLGYFVKSES